MDEEKKPCFIVISFKEVESAAFGIKYENVTPEQVLLAAEILRMSGEDNLKQKAVEVQRRIAEQQLAVPKPGILRPNQ